MPITGRDSTGQFEWVKITGRDATGLFEWVKATGRDNTGLYEWTFGGKLYTASHGSRSAGELYELDRNTGVATKVANRPGFGVREYNPGGMAWDGTNLYMAGTNEILYTVNFETGLATRVGRDSLNRPINGMVWDGTNLLSVSDENNVIRALDRTTGGYQSGGPAYQVPSGSLGSPSSLAWDGATLYATQYGTSAALYTVDIAGRRVSKVGTAIQFGAGIRSPQGLTWDGTTLLMVDTVIDALFSVDRNTGIATRIGNADRFGVNLGQVTSLVWVQ